MAILLLGGLMANDQADAVLRLEKGELLGHGMRSPRCGLEGKVGEGNVIRVARGFEGALEVALILL